MSPHTQSLLAHVFPPADRPRALADPARLAEAVDLAITDWRDLLLGAGFAHDPEAHLHWCP